MGKSQDAPEILSEKELTKLRVVDLRKLLTKYDLQTQGLKAEMIKRLLSYYQDFEGSNSVKKSDNKRTRESIKESESDSDSNSEEEKPIKKKGRVSLIIPQAPPILDVTVAKPKSKRIVESSESEESSSEEEEENRKVDNNIQPPKKDTSKTVELKKIQVEDTQMQMEEEEEQGKIIVPAPKETKMEVELKTEEGETLRRKIKDLEESLLKKEEMIGSMTKRIEEEKAKLGSEKSNMEAQMDQMKKKLESTSTQLEKMNSVKEKLREENIKLKNGAQERAIISKPLNPALVPFYNDEDLLSSLDATISKAMPVTITPSGKQCLMDHMLHVLSSLNDAVKGQEVTVDMIRQWDTSSLLKLGENTTDYLHMIEASFFSKLIDEGFQWRMRPENHQGVLDTVYHIGNVVVTELMMVAGESVRLQREMITPQILHVKPAEDAEFSRIFNGYNGMYHQSKEENAIHSQRSHLMELFKFLRELPSSHLPIVTQRMNDIGGVISTTRGVEEALHQWMEERQDIAGEILNLWRKTQYRICRTHNVELASDNACFKQRVFFIRMNDTKGMYFDYENRYYSTFNQTFHSIMLVGCDQPSLLYHEEVMGHTLVEPQDLNETLWNLPRFKKEEEVLVSGNILRDVLSQLGTTLSMEDFTTFLLILSEGSPGGECTGASLVGSALSPYLS
ncbi:hypothetical protein PROFUN_06417 [Planoprotostelium fungivorum]|uniref:SAP domain-containing protein n=1 Tax=Planoprotostelium fungivorum TaxID=1890364 RepID=A0A2P6NP09_9EUKA|nr:hypothetical protein PROFUN_06417 [Planoprotostelium fungivorum]